MKTVLLDTVAWDLVVDVRGDIAVADVPYALAQDAASAIKTFLGEVWFDTTLGVPYATILGATPPLAYIKAKLIDAALTVPGVVGVECFITSVADRSIRGQVQVRTSSGQTAAAGF